MIANDLDPGLTLFVKAALGRKARRLALLDLRGLTDVADVFMICSGQSNRQVSAIAEHIQRELKKSDIRPISVEGGREGQWVLMDYGHIVIHIFYDPIRQFFDLEGLWADAERIDIEPIVDALGLKVEME